MRPAGNKQFSKQKAFTDSLSIIRHAKDDVVSFHANEWNQCHGYDSLAKVRKLFSKQLKSISRVKN